MPSIPLSASLAARPIGRGGVLGHVLAVWLLGTPSCSARVLLGAAPPTHTQKPAGASTIYMVSLPSTFPLLLWWRQAGSREEWCEWAAQTIAVAATDFPTPTHSLHPAGWRASNVKGWPAAAAAAAAAPAVHHHVSPSSQRQQQQQPPPPLPQRTPPPPQPSTNTARGRVVLLRPAGHGLDGRRRGRQPSWRPLGLQHRVGGRPPACIPWATLSFQAASSRSKA